MTGTEADRLCARCGCTLSRYNTETECAACPRATAEMYRALPAVSPRVWDDPDVRRALATWDTAVSCPNSVPANAA